MDPRFKQWQLPGPLGNSTTKSTKMAEMCENKTNATK